MSPTAQLIVDLVKNAGGKLSYPEVKAKIPPQDWRRIPSAFKEARGAGLLDQEVVFADGVNTHNYIYKGN